MADDELNAIRAQRLAELQKQQNAPSHKDKDDVENAQSRETEMRNSILSQVLSQTARARLNTIATAKPEKAKMVENMLMNMARMGQIQGKLDEEELIGVLERVSEQTQRKTTVKFDRRRAALDDDDGDI